MYLSYDVGGYKGVAVLRAVVMAGLALTVARASLARSSGLVASAATLLALVAVFPGTGERPQLVSFLLFAVLGPWLLRSMSTGGRTWPFVILVMAWSNLHGFWCLAVLLYVACGMGAVCDGARGSRRSLALRHGARALGSIFAAMVNPNGYHTLLAPFRVTDYASFVSERGPPSLLNPFQLAAFALLGLVIVGWARSGRPVAWLTRAPMWWQRR